MAKHVTYPHEFVVGGTKFCARPGCGLTRQAGVHTLAKPRLLTDPPFTYTTTVSWPEHLQVFIDQIVGEAGITGISQDGLSIEIEATDDYELAGTVHNLAAELEALGYGSVEIPRPSRKPVDNA